MNNLAYSFSQFKDRRLLCRNHGEPEPERKPDRIR